MRKFKLPKVGAGSVSHSPVVTIDDDGTEISIGDNDRQRNILLTLLSIVTLGLLIIPCTFMVRELTFFAVTTGVIIIINLLIFISFEFYEPVEVTIYCKIYAEYMAFRCYIYIMLGLCLLEIGPTGPTRIFSLMSIILSVIILIISLIFKVKPPQTILSWNDNSEHKFYVNSEYREIFSSRNYTSENIQNTNGTSSALQASQGVQGGGNVHNMYQKL